MSIKLPPLRPFDTYECDGYTEKDYCDDGLYVTVEEVEARERILLARIKELEADAAQPVAWQYRYSPDHDWQYVGAHSARVLVGDGDEYRALYAAPQAPPAAVPEGYVLVPVEPTINMLQAALDVSRRQGNLIPVTREYHIAEILWRAMLAAERKGE